MKIWHHKVCLSSFSITVKSDRQLSSTAAELPVKFHSEKLLKCKLIASRLSKIGWCKWDYAAVEPKNNNSSLLYCENCFLSKHTTLNRLCGMHRFKVSSFRLRWVSKNAWEYNATGHVNITICEIHLKTLKSHASFIYYFPIGWIILIFRTVHPSMTSCRVFPLDLTNS